MNSFTRRDFTRLSAFTLAAGFAPSLRAQDPAPSTDRKIGYAVIGLEMCIRDRNLSSDPFHN